MMRANPHGMMRANPHGSNTTSSADCQGQQGRHHVRCKRTIPRPPRDEIQAAVGRVLLKRLDAGNARRWAIAAYYASALG